MNYLDLSGLRVVTCKATFSLAGAWVADVALADDTPIPPGRVALTLGNLTLSGTVVTQDVFAGQRLARVVAGAASWGIRVTPRAYKRPGGVPRAVVASDLALEVGEVLADILPGLLSEDFVRESAPASRILEQLVGPTWWVDVAGLTHTAPRPAGQAIASEYLVEEYDGAAGRLRGVSTEDLAAWVPGAIVQAPAMAGPVKLSSVTIRTTADDSVRIDATCVALASDLPERLLVSLRAIIRAELRELTFLGIYEYSVASARVDADGVSRFSGYPVTASDILPNLSEVALRPGLPGAQIVPQVGSKLLVAFVNADPQRPVVLGYDEHPPMQVSIGTGPLGVQNVAVKAGGEGGSPATISFAATGAGSSVKIDADTPLGVVVGGDDAVPLARFPELEAFAAAVVAGFAALPLPIKVPPLAPTCSTTKLRSN